MKYEISVTIYIRDRASNDQVKAALEATRSAIGRAVAAAGLLDENADAVIELWSTRRVK